MTRERAKRLAEQWSKGMVCTLREGEAEEYHKLCLSVLCAQQEPQWISVKDRLPDNDESDLVLAVVNGHPTNLIEIMGAYQFAEYSKKYGWVIESYPLWDNPEVTHWMPLPEPPEEDV